MKNLIVIIAVFFSLTAFSQRIAFVDTDYILGQVQEYTNAQVEIDQLSEKWRKEIEEKYKHEKHALF